jgi:hypothetical protein
MRDRPASPKRQTFLQRLDAETSRSRLSGGGFFALLLIVSLVSGSLTFVLAWKVV